MSDTTVARCACPKCRNHDTGRRGPYTPAEFIEAFGVVNEPPPVEVPVELVELGIAAYGIEVSVNIARRLVEDAVANYTSLRDSDPAKQLALDAVNTARGVYEEEAARLTEARAAYNAVQNRITTEKAYAEYTETLAAQAAAIDARQQVALDAAPRSALQRIKKRVTR